MADRHAAEDIAFSTGEDFAAMLEESLADRSKLEGTVVKGIVIDIDNDMALIDVGLKSEGRVPLKEFAAPGEDDAGATEIAVGDEVEVFVERMENRNGEAMLSRERARREHAHGAPPTKKPYRLG